MVVAFGGADFDVTRMQLEGGVVASNLAFLAPEGASPTLIVLLAAVDVFSIWNVILLVLGVTVVGGIGSGAGAAIVGSLWGLWIVIRLGFSLLSSGGG